MQIPAKQAALEESDPLLEATDSHCLDGPLALYFPAHDSTASQAPRRFNDDDICEISSALRVQDSPWVDVPRLYSVLRLIDRLDDIELFTARGVTDLWLPLTKNTFPKGLSATTRSLFLATQTAVLSTSLDLEKGERGLHRHYSAIEDVPLSSEGTLGTGSYGEVDRVKSTLTRTEYARKRIPRRFPAQHGERRSRQIIENFEKEIKAIKHLSHHHIVKLVGSYTDPTCVALIISPVADLDLRAFMEAYTPTDASKALLRGFFGCLLAGLAYMHHMSIRHKDIKPANILIKGDSVLYTDLGLAFYWEAVGHSTTEDSSPVATRKYSPPEIFTGEKRNTSADIFSLGCVFLEMATLLDGSTLDKLQEHLASYGTQSTIYGTNLDGGDTWIDRLKSATNTEESRASLDIVRTMLSKIPWKRPSAQAAFERFSFIDAAAGGTPFVRSCCKPLPKPASSASSITSFPIPVIQISQAAPSSGSQDTVRTIRRSRSPSIQSQDSSSQLSVSSHHNEPITPPPSSPSLSESGHDDPVTFSPSKFSIKRNRPDRNTLVLNASLITAVLQKDVKKARALIEEGAHVDFQDFEGTTALTKAVVTSNTEMVSMFLEKGADIYLQDKHGETCFHYAADKANIDIVTMLLDRGADPNLPGNERKSALYYAVTNARCERRQLINFLVSRGADAKTSSQGLWNPLHRAAAFGSDDILEQLISLGISIDCVQVHNCTPLYLASAKGHTSCVATLLSLGANPEIRRVCGRTPLIAAAQCGKVDIVKKLLEHGADINAKDNYAYTALFLASQNGHVRVAEILLGCGKIDFGKHLDKHGCSPLHCAALAKRIETAKLLLEHGASIQLRTCEGHTPLHQAVTSKSPEMVKLLLEYGADLFAVTKRGASAIDIAVKEGLVDILHLLEDAVEEEEQREGA